MEGRQVAHLASEEEVEGGHGETRVAVGVGDAEEIFCGSHFKARLLSHLTCHTLLGGLADVGKAAGQVKGATGRFPVTTGHKQPTLFIDDDGNIGSAGVEKKLKTAAGATVALLAVWSEQLTAADRAETES